MKFTNFPWYRTNWYYHRVQVKNFQKKNRSKFSPFDPPDNRNDINDRMTPNISVVSSVYTLPVFGSGRSNSKLLPREIRISWDFVPEKLPWTAWVMVVERWRVRLYKNMIWYRGFFCMFYFFIWKRKKENVRLCTAWKCGCPWNINLSIVYCFEYHDHSVELSVNKRWINRTRY